MEDAESSKDAMKEFPEYAPARSSLGFNSSTFGMIKTAQLHETISKLEGKLKAKEEEVTNLKKIMRKMFMANENKIVD
jgi:hypothetical protein